MRYLGTTGLILRKQNSGENDWFLTIFSPEHGKIQAVSKSSRKIPSKKGSHLDLLNLCQFQLYKNGTKYLITECKLQQGFLSIKNDLEKSIYSLHLAEIALKFIQDDLPNPDIFKLLIETLNQLENSDNHQLLIENYKINLLKHSGLWPEISNCHFCQIKWQAQEKIWTDQYGHLTCQNCLNLNQNNLESISFNTIKLSHFLSSNKLSQPSKLRLTKNDLFQLKKLTDLLLHNFLQHELKSSQLLNFGNLQNTF
jgi:DNA repair protein RecO (recombination protein O)